MVRGDKAALERVKSAVNLCRRLYQVYPDGRLLLVKAVAGATVRAYR